MGNEGLSWDLSLGADVSGGQRFLSTLDGIDQTLKRVDNNLRGTEQQTKRTGEAHRRHAHDVDNLGSSVHRMADKVEYLGHQWTYAYRGLREFAEFTGLILAYEITEKLVEKVVELGREIVTTAAKSERTEKSFGLLFGTEGAKDQLEYVEQVGKHTEFTHERLKGVAQELAKVGFKGDSLVRAQAAALDIASFSSNKEEGLSGALSSLERLKRTGRVDNRTLGGLGVGENDFLAELSKRTGKGTETLKKEMEKGTVNANDSLEALYTIITKKTGKALGGAGVLMSTTLGATLTHLGELPDRYFEKLAHSSGFDRFSQMAAGVLGELDPDSPRGKAIFSRLESAFNTTAEILASIDLAGMFEKALDVVEKIELGWLVVQASMGGESGKRADEMIGKIGLHKRLEADKAAGAAENQKEDLHLEGTQFLDEFDQPVLMGPVQHAGEKLGDAWGSGQEKGARKALGTHSPSTVFQDIGQDVADGFAGGLAKGQAASQPQLAVSIPAAAGAQAAGGGGPTVHVGGVHVTVQAGAGATEDEIRSAARAVVEEITPAAVQSAIEQMAIQAAGS